MTIIKTTCGDCSVVFEHEENPRFPRKYCMKCSAARKKSWNEGSKTAPTPEKATEQAPAAPKQEYHLTIEQSRSNALASTIEYLKLEGLDQNSVSLTLGIAETFEKYILDGVK